MTLEEFRKLPEEEKARIREKLFQYAAKASTDLEYGGEDDDMRFHRPHPRNPLVDGWYPGGCDWDEFGEMPKWEDK